MPAQATETAFSGSSVTQNRSGSAAEIFPLRTTVPRRRPASCGLSPTDSAPAAPPESALLQAMGFDPVGLDALMVRTGMDTAAMQVELLELELAGVVARLPGGLFQRMGNA